MTYFSSGYVSQMMHGQNALFSQNNYMAQQISPGQAGMAGPPPPPMNIPPPPTMMTRGGQVGERLAGGMHSAATNIGMPLASGGIALAGGLHSAGMMRGGMMGAMGGAASMLDPFSMGMRGASMGYGAMGGGAMGVAGGLAGAGAVALPMYGAYKAAQAYGGAFQGGMQDQMGLNSNLRQSFQFQGGRGQGGRGFGQQQMGAIGGIIQQELNRNVFSNAGEMNQLISGGTQAGMFQGVRDVSQFAQKFRKMLDTLKSVQTELGGSLTEALQFVQESRQAGVFNQMDRAQFATQIRQTTQATGMSRQDAMSLAVQGAQVARQAGGVGAQGAIGAQRMAQTMGTALSTGAVSESMLSEATGGQTGQAAISAFTTQMMQTATRQMRRPAGRFALFGMAGANGRIDRGMMTRLQTGDIDVAGLRSAAHRNVRSMGRAQAINREGELRGQVLEEGGLSAMIGITRMRLGDRAMNAGSDVSSLVMQRRLGMSRQQAEVMQGLMRNQGTIATQESMDRMTSAQGARRERLVTQERSLDAVMRHVGHSLQEGMGLNEVRMAGRRFVTNISEGVDRMMDQMLGLASDEMSSATRGALQRAATGQMRDSDRDQLRMVSQMGEGGGGGRFDAFRQTALQDLGLAPGRSLGNRLGAMGFNVRGQGAGGTAEALASIRTARAGSVSEGQQGQLDDMMQNRTQFTRMLNEARLEAETAPGGGSGGMFGRLQQRFGIAPEAAMAFMARTGMAQAGGEMDMGQVVEGGALGGIRRGAVNVGRAMGVEWMTERMGVGGEGTLEAALGVSTTAENRRERQLGFIMRGGHMGVQARQDATEAAAESARGGLTGARDEMVTALNATMRGKAVGRAEQHREGIRRRYQYQATLRAGALQRGEGGAQASAARYDISREQLEALGEDDEYRRVMLRMSGGGPGARDALAQLNSMAGSAEDPDRRKALSSLAAQAGREVDRTGRIGDDLLATASSPRAREELQAGLRLQREFGAGILGGARQMSALAQELGQTDITAALSEAGNAFLADDPVGAGQTLSTFVSESAHLGAEERSLRIGQLAASGSEELQALGVQIANQGRFREELIGRRGGGRRRFAAALQGGGGLGGEGLRIQIGEGDQRRTISGRRANAMLQRELRRGEGVGQHSTAIRSALQRQMTEAGITDSGMRESIMGGLEGVARGGTYEERAEAADVMENLRKDYSDQFATLDANQARAAQSAAARRDPMGQRRNELLESILAAPGVANTAANSVPPGEGSGGSGSGSGVQLDHGGL